MRWDKLEQQRRMQHEDETLYQGPVRSKWPKEPFRGLGKFKTKPKLPRRTFEDRRGEVPGTEVLMAKMLSKDRPRQKGKPTCSKKRASTRRRGQQSPKSAPRHNWTEEVSPSHEAVP